MADEKLIISINVESMTWDDMRLLMDASDPTKMIDIFDRFVEGGAKAVPIARTQEVVAAIVEAIGELTNPKN